MTGAAETVALDVCLVVTTLFAAPVALAGTVTVAPACVETVFDDPFRVMTLPFGDVMIAPEGTITDSFAVMVTEAPAATVAGAAEPGLAAVVEFAAATAGDQHRTDAPHENGAQENRHGSSFPNKWERRIHWRFLMRPG